MDDAGSQPVATPPAASLSAARTYRLVLAYDGTAYHGWQVQPDAPTVQGSLLAAAGRLFAEGARVVGASRTDAGVHALRQTVALSATSALAPEALLAALNAYLPREIRVVAAAEAAVGFDARRAAVGKRYAYLIDRAAVASPLLLRYAWHVPGRLDLDAMRLALRSLRGTHDFSAFCAAPGRHVVPVCHVRAIHLVTRRARLALLISADRFLHHMVRNIVGSAIEIGRGARPAGWLAEVLATRDRTRGGPTAPAQGLTLVRVRYC